MAASTQDRPDHQAIPLVRRIPAQQCAGRTLLIGATGRGDFPGGDRDRLYGSLQRLGGLRPDPAIWPAHDHHRRRRNRQATRGICETP